MHNAYKQCMNYAFRFILECKKNATLSVTIQKPSRNIFLCISGQDLNECVKAYSLNHAYLIIHAHAS